MSEFLIDLHVATTDPMFGTIDAHPTRTAKHLEFLGRVCLRIKQLARAFLGTRILNEPAVLLSLQTFDMEDLPQDLTNGAD